MITVLDQVEVTSRCLEVHVASEVLEAETRVRVLAPCSGVDAPDRPVLWLLHGGDDDFRSWTDAGAAEAVTEALDAWVVMPDCGPGGWYTDWFRVGPAPGTQQWETHHLVELRSWIETTRRTRTDRGGRAVVGLSMGGYGALVYSARHPELFGFCAAFSPAADIVDPDFGVFVDALSALNGGEPGCIWGDRLRQLDNWRAHNPVDLAERLASTQLQLRTRDGRAGGPFDEGTTDDLVERAVWHTACTMHRRLDELGIAHLWSDEGPGAHDWPYWTADLTATLPAVTAYFAGAPAR
ncbi:MAG: esterase family protein [Actinomycetota bacterium]|nr:esterase family protein [Actinomycetota bacterium]